MILRVKYSYFEIFIVVNRPYFVPHTIPYNVFKFFNGSSRNLRGLTKSGTGTWGLGRGTGTRGSDKQTTPNFCAEFVRYNFRWSRESYHMQESLLVVADGF